MKRQKIKPSIGEPLGIDPAARAMNIDRRTLQRCVDESPEIVPIDNLGTRGSARYTLADCIAAYTLHREKRNQAGEVDELERQRIRLTKAKADVAEIEASLRRGTALDAAATEHVMSGMILTARARFLTLPRKLAPIVSQGTAVEAERALEKEIRTALEELAGFDAGKVYQRYLDQQRIAAAPEEDESAE
jgi:phage terminase Nu1 subunit (DNA packaging protein)